MNEMAKTDKVLSRKEAGVPCGPIYSIDQTFADPQVRHLGIATPMSRAGKGDVHVVSSPVNAHDVPRKVRRHTPDRGEHTDEILREFGYTDPQLKAMRASGVIA